MSLIKICFIYFPVSWWKKKDVHMLRFIQEVNTTTRSCALWDLEAETDYIVHVQSISVHGTSPPSETLRFRTPKEAERQASKSKPHTHAHCWSLYFHVQPPIKECVIGPKSIVYDGNLVHKCNFFFYFSITFFFFEYLIRSQKRYTIHKSYSWAIIHPKKLEADCPELRVFWKPVSSGQKWFETSFSDRSRQDKVLNQLIELWTVTFIQPSC